MLNDLAALWRWLLQPRVRREATDALPKLALRQSLHQSHLADRDRLPYKLNYLADS
jgi:hypothetical protein